MDLNKKMVSEFMKFDNVDLKTANVALQVFLELCEVKKYYEVYYKYDKGLKLLYFTAKKQKSEEPTIFIPRSSYDDLNFDLMQTYFQLSTNEIKKVCLALVCADSTCVFYEISEGLQPLTDSTENQERLKQQDLIDAGIKKHRDLILEAALCGTSITITGEGKS